MSMYTKDRSTCVHDSLLQQHTQPGLQMILPANATHPMCKDDVMKCDSLCEPALLHDHVAAVASLAQEVRGYDANAHAAAAEELLGLIGRHTNAHGSRRVEAQDSRYNRKQRCLIPRTSPFRMRVAGCRPILLSPRHAAPLMCNSGQRCYLAMT